MLYYNKNVNININIWGYCKKWPTHIYKISEEKLKVKKILKSSE